MRDVIQCLWVGSELSPMEQLTVASFLYHGHEVHLYVYEDVENVPDGTRLVAGEEILPASWIFQYKDRPSYSAFSNYFRYKLLLERGGWWVDTDMVCLRPFDFERPYVFSSEFFFGKTSINVGAIKAPAGAALIRDAWEVCLEKERDKLVWGEIGPKLMEAMVEKHGLESFAEPHTTFCPVSDWRLILDPEATFEIDESAYAVHLWNEVWRRHGQDKKATYPAGCLYEKLKRRYLGA